MKRAIITGATGAIGTALVRELIERNIEVLVLCRKDSKRNGQIPVHPLVTLKYCSLDQLAALENDTGKEYDAFYHFAWAGTTGDSRNDMYLQNLNVKYALDAVTAAKKFGCSVFIGAGSQAEYGRVEGQLKPDTPVFPENGYGIAKLCAGQMTRERSHQLGIRHVWTRILSIYGPCDGENTLIMSLIRELLAGRRPSCTKGEQLWDYLYSIDAARALYLLGEKGKDGRIYCIGSGQALPLVEYIKNVRDQIDPNLELGLGDIPYNDKQVMYLEADITDLTNDTGFQVEYSFEKGIQETIQWYKKKSK